MTNVRKALNTGTAIAVPVLFPLQGNCWLNPAASKWKTKLRSRTSSVKGCLSRAWGRWSQTRLAQLIIAGDADGYYLFRSYRDALQQALRLRDASEHTHRPALKALLEALHPGLTATNEPKRSDVGAPDFILRTGGGTAGFVETKDIGVSLDAVEKSEQLQRYRKAFPNLLLTDYLEFRWYVDGQRRARARLGEKGDGGAISLDAKGVAEVSQLLADFALSALLCRPAPVT